MPEPTMAERHLERSRDLAESLRPNAGRCIITFAADLVPRLVELCEAVEGEVAAEHVEALAVAIRERDEALAALVRLHDGTRGEAEACPECGRLQRDGYHTDECSIGKAVAAALVADLVPRLVELCEAVEGEVAAEHVEALARAQSFVSDALDRCRGYVDTITRLERERDESWAENADLRERLGRAWAHGDQCRFEAHTLSCRQCAAACRDGEIYGSELCEYGRELHDRAWPEDAPAAYVRRVDSVLNATRGSGVVPARR